ncbi:hypothetical protein BRADI_2g05763v3 [Brachypodium distachyon]|uniref:Hydrophobic seed protein domain-containing protein n=1 Tax=Brachypodium distachyon TaxID=15368 RepID=A0A0Q3IRX2_BRADI|nr:hypothetical protein BRADI_2g05763v3 [Brachypodium distachyon]
MARRGAAVRGSPRVGPERLLLHLLRRMWLPLGGSGRGGSDDDSRPGGGGRGGQCPIDTLKLGVCARVVNRLINLELGTPPKKTCCALMQACWTWRPSCASARRCTHTSWASIGAARIHPVHQSQVLHVPVDLSLLVNYCGKSVLGGF